jgi:hypothetical protein
MQQLQDMYINFTIRSFEKIEMTISPSSEIAPPKKRNNKNQSLGEKSNKSVGGQLGREGVTLLQSDTPDEIFELPYKLLECKKCSIDISAVVARLKEKR